MCNFSKNTKYKNIPSQYKKKTDLINLRDCHEIRLLIDSTHINYTEKEKPTKINFRDRGITQWQSTYL